MKSEKKEKEIEIVFPGVETLLEPGVESARVFLVEYLEEPYGLEGIANPVHKTDEFVNQKEAFECFGMMKSREEKRQAFQVRLFAAQKYLDYKGVYAVIKKRLR